MGREKKRAVAAIAAALEAHLGAEVPPEKISVRRGVKRIENEQPNLWALAGRQEQMTERRLLRRRDR